ncbi:nucleoside deaminase [Rhizorhabdus histidinilytica]|uniref:tRNA(Arg) A34 adenosine deaminase TadA n=1 Tax=Rhizorhabdus histidinilytica TaxID=439228 RepID=A0A1T5EAS1_9SPHN|nr:nucleoside deaminase [Rhizorhabdus histidinilytica]SKB80785.1 tRNA(Arg) A34 adenosine deaminase TadA [Rhizorhabdus histidinilytica]
MTKSSTDAEQGFLRAAIELARDNVAQGGRPFGAVVVKDGAIVAVGVNEILATNDPTAHAELGAIRAAARRLATPDLSGCTVYASGHPCPMCMAAMRMAGIGAVAYAYSNEDGEPFGLSTAAVQAAILADLGRPAGEQAMAVRHRPVDGAERPDIYAEWQRRRDLA